MTPSRSLRVCIVCPHFYPVIGGGQIRFTRYMPGLAARGFEPRIFSGTAKPKKVTDPAMRARWADARAGEKLPDDDVNGFPLHWYRIPDREPGRSMWFGRLLDAHCHEPDGPHVVHWLGPVRYVSTPWLRRMRSRGVRLVYSVTMVPTYKGSGLRRTLDRARQRALLDTFDAIVPNAQVAADALAELGVHSPVEVVPNGVDTQRFRPAEDAQERREIRERLGLPPDARIVIAVGTVSPRKGSHLLVEAWRAIAAKLPDAFLLFAGTRKDRVHEGLGGFNDDLDRALENSGASERVRFTGFVKNVDELLRAADLCVLASEREGSPNSVLEALASGTAVLLTPFEGLSRELGAAGREFAQCDRSPEALAENIVALLDDAERRETLARSGRAHVVAHGSLEATIDRLGELYRSLVAGTVRGGV